MQAAMGDKAIQEMFQAIEKASGSVLQRHGNAGDRILDQRFRATPEVIAYGYAYCVKRKRNKYRRYRSSRINGRDSERFSGRRLLSKNT